MAPSARLRWLWFGFLVTSVVLGLFLVLQYRWLGELERSSTIARRALLGKLLDVISKEAAAELQATVGRALDVPADELDDPARGPLGELLAQAPHTGVRRFFVASFRAKHPLFFFDATTHAVAVPEWSEETTAAWTAVAPWGVLAKNRSTHDYRRVHAEERDARHRILIRPVTDAAARVVGVAGAILDDGHFAREVLPRTVAATLPAFSAADELQVFIGDEHGRAVLPGAAAFPKKEWLVARKLAPPYSGWTLAVRDRRTTPERWARRNFALNMSISALLALLLLGGILTTLRAASREMRLSRMKSDFVSNVSHELRTPLASIRVFGELMRKGQVTSAEKVREYGERIENESRRLTHLVNNILDFSRIESGRKSFATEEADLAQIVTATVEDFAPHVRARGFRIDVLACRPPLPPVRADREALDQALANLLDNAVKYSGDSRVIEVQLARRDSYAVITVRDRGIGIPGSELQRIFERFHRVGTGLVHDVRGVGLGLAIVRHVVEAHGGKVEVASEPGRGSAFSILLPLGARVAVPAAPQVQEG